MSKEVQYTIRVEPDLKNNFLESTKNREDRPGSQVLREFMREYVAKDVVKPSLITADEQSARQKAVEFATASVGLEGFELTDADREFASLYVHGEIDIEAFIASVINQVEH